jgi:hypothetical protein
MIWLLVIDIGAGPHLFLLQNDMEILEAEETSPGHWITEVNDEG